ncbi:Outer membrane protein TolC [Catalinimonas alkaloidigena]|uniref:Outer membrane protein TolC n=1 Tax=Catalinimonas alkaloidigena TaxID=1075417 RepID=A0A1G9AVB3_9BACT|nr:TolC family protein [Catalinimonas alkaloidigena]SDK31211.1 Outer membrane protein TolC [Catalinimonas alkaloidigena]
MRYLKSLVGNCGVRIVLWLVLTLPAARAQDSTIQFTLQDLYGLMRETHPVVRQAELYQDIADAEVRQARGNFDPKAIASYQRKEFGEKTYYNNWNSYLKVPVWPGGIELQAGYERAIGSYVNDETQTPAAGLAYAGVVVPLGQGMFLDQRRATLRQAQIYQTMAAAERQKLLNKIFWSATKDYYDWFLAVRQVELLQESIGLAQALYEATRERARFGDLAPIDTVEAKINLQSRQLQWQQAQLAVQNARNLLSTYLWDEGGQPVVLDGALRPDAFRRESYTAVLLDSLLDVAQRQHPELLKLSGKVDQLQIDQRWSREQLKPKLDLKLNLLSATPHVGDDLSYAFFSNNYRVGVDFSFPLFLRKERGKLQAVTAKVKQAGWERQYLARSIDNALRNAWNEVLTYENLLVQQTDMVNNYRQLRDGELEKFENGESSLFLINSRETKLLEAETKLAELQIKYGKAYAQLFAEAGILGNEPLADR